MYAHVQKLPWKKEAGGEVFAITSNGHGLIVTTATGPNKGDRRGTHSFNPDVDASTRDRIFQYTKGRHAVGLWHTHPENNPSPSGLDRQTVEEYLKAFQGDRDRYLMVILGNRGDPPNMAVWSAGRNDWGRWVELIEN